MRIVLSVGLLIIFITSFFILAMGSSFVKQTVVCEEMPYRPDNVNCRLAKLNMDTLVTFFMVISFLIADVGAVYLMITSWKV